MKTLLAFVIATLLTGCVSVGRKLDQAQVDQIHEGEFRENVRAMIGPPDSVTRNGQVEIWNYTYIRSTPKPESFVPFVGPFVGGANTTHQFVQITFGKDGRVTNITTTVGGNEMQMGK